ncbi:hypothetical protein N9L26_02130 [Candidatus Pacebacteria bacterium]|nr:hypothetical protein [Candidatus Paceibacterota bacterium]
MLKWSVICLLTFFFGVATAPMVYAQEPLPKGYVAFAVDKPAILVDRMNRHFQETQRLNIFSERNGRQQLNVRMLALDLYNEYDEDRASFPDFERYLIAFKSHNGIKQRVEELSLERLKRGLWRPGYRSSMKRVAAAQADDRIGELSIENDQLKRRLQELETENEQLKQKIKDHTGLISLMTRDLQTKVCYEKRAFRNDP